MNKLFSNILFILILFMLPCIVVHSQVLMNNGGYIDARGGSYIYVDGSVHNSEGEMTVAENSGVNAEMYVLNDITNDATITGNGYIRLLGDWYNNNTFNAGTGTVFFEGDNQLLGGTTPTSFHNLTLDGTGLKTQQIDQYCTGILDLKHLELQTETHVFFMENTNQGAIIRTTGFVSSLNGGFLSRNTNLTSTYLFPVGSSLGVTRYRPVEITPENSVSNTYTVRMANLDASIEDYDITSLEPAVSEVNSLFYHQINRTSGTSAVTMDIFFNTGTDGAWEGIANWSSSNTQWEAIPSSYVNNATPLDYAEETAWNDFSDDPYILSKVVVDPLFDDLGPYCVGDTPDPLPDTSLNGISGTWSPSVISTASAGTTAYTFTPDDSQQYNQYVMDVTVEPLPDATISGPDNVCVDDSPHTFSAATPGGTWSGTGITDAVTGEFTPGIAGVGTHTIYYDVTSGNCSNTGTHDIEVHDLPAVDIVEANDPLCYGDTTGSITVSSPGAADPVFIWPGIDVGPTIENLSAGTYTVIVEDTWGCTSTQDITLSNPPELSISITNAEDVTCYGDADGSATAQASGGTGSYSFEWSNQQTGATLNNVEAGVYLVTVTDDNGCEAITSATIDQPDALELEPNVSPVICGINPGACGVTVTGGNGGYSYNWEGFGTGGSTQTGLTAGDYTVSVTDAEGCSAELTMTVPTHGNLTVNITETPLVCHGDSNAVLTANCTDGTPPLDYSWDTGENTQTIDGLGAGSYSVTVNDDLGCSGSNTHYIADPQPITVSFLTEPVSCYGGSDGYAVAIVDGGTYPYSYDWNGLSSQDSLMDQPSGYYHLVVTDVNGCQNSDSVFIDQPEEALGIDIIKRDISCYGYQDGKISAGGLNGTPPYSYEWHFNGNTTTNSTLFNLMSGQYDLTLTDSRGCTADTSINIYEPAPLTADYVSQDPSCIGNNDGYIELDVQGGTEPYTFYWDTYSFKLPYLNNLFEDNYNITIIDANGCEYELETISLVDVPVECLQIPNAFTPNGDGNNDTWIIENLEMFPKHHVQVFNRWGQVMYEGHYGDDPWEGTTLTGKKAPTGTYIYVIKLFKGAQVKSGSVTLVY